MARLARDKCLLPTLGLYLHGVPASMGVFARLADTTAPTARKSLDAMKRYGLVTATFQKRGSTRVASIALTDLGRRVGQRLHELDLLMDQAAKG